MYELIAQEHHSGCSVACTACLLGVPYQEALKLFPPGMAEDKGYYCHEIVDALYKGGLQYNWGWVDTIGKERFEELLKIEGSIVYVDNSQGLPRGHYLVRTKKGWMNSWSNFCTWPTEAAYVQDLPGKPLYVVYQLEVASWLAV